MLVKTVPISMTNPVVKQSATILIINVLFVYVSIGCEVTSSMVANPLAANITAPIESMINSCVENERYLW